MVITHSVSCTKDVLSCIPVRAEIYSILPSDDVKVAVQIGSDSNTVLLLGISAVAGISAVN